MAHAVQAALSLHPDWVVLELDVANAFHSFNRTSMFDALRQSPFSFLIPFFCIFYATPSPLHFRNGPILKSLQSASGLYTDWDNELLGHFTGLIGTEFWPPEFDHLSSAHLQPFFPTRLGGFGLRSSAGFAGLSFLCSWAQTVPLLASHCFIDGSPIFRPFITTDSIDRLEPCIVSSMARLPSDILNLFPSWPALLPRYPHKHYSYLSQLHEAAMLKRVRSTVTSPLHLARLTSLQGPHAEDWLAVAPSSQHLHLYPTEWKIATALRLGLPIPHLTTSHTCVCGFSYADLSIASQVLRCPTGNEPNRVHDAVKHEIHRIVKELGLPSQLEDSHLLAGHCPDISFRDTNSGVTWALDVRVADPRHGFPHSNAATTIGSAVGARELEKTSLYAALVHERHDVKFFPLAIENFGCFGKTFVQFLQDCSRRGAARIRDLSGMTYLVPQLLETNFFKRVSFVLQREQARTVCRRSQIRLSVAPDLLAPEATLPAVVDFAYLGPDG
ncbi:unnamed protein product [Closterium sp. NIES-53]